MVASDRRTRTESYRLLARTLDALGPEATQALLAELAVPHHDEGRVRKLTRLLVQVSEVPPPEPISAWIRADPARRRAIVAAWRDDIRAAGKLPPEVADE